jgi:hypothetical protein
MGGGFEAYMGNKIRYQNKVTETSGDSTEVQSSYVEDAGRAYHSGYFEMLGEQGYPGLFLWLLLQVSGLWQMERIRWKWKKRERSGGLGPDERWVAPLANALQTAQCIYLVGALFIGIAYQPFILMLIGLQCGLWSYLRRVDAPAPHRIAERGVRPLAAPASPLAGPTGALEA